MAFEIATLRLINQQLLSSNFTNPSDVVSWFGAIQAQDFAAAKWAIGQRLINQTDTSIETYFNEGHILRTHVMRPTWHFVAPSDIRWLLTLTSPRVHRFNGYYYRRSGLDNTIFEKSNFTIKKALVGGKKLTRSELDVKLREANIPTQNLGLTFTIMQAELDGIICSGPRRGKQFTYMLLDERVPKQKNLTYDESLVEITKRYFQSHGPAQLKDFMWWSGLSLTETKRGLSLLGNKISEQEQNGKIYWFFPVKKQKIQHSLKAFLIPGFDEYFISYKDRSNILDIKYKKYLNQGGGMINGAVVVNGKMVGGWKRTFHKKSVVVSINLFEKINLEESESIKMQAKQFGNFLNMNVELHQNSQ